MLQTIPKFCRQLKEVTFFMASSQRTAYPDDGGSDKLQEHLKAWPKVRYPSLLKRGYIDNNFDLFISLKRLLWRVYRRNSPKSF